MGGEVTVPRRSPDVGGQERSTPPPYKTRDGGRGTGCGLGGIL